MDPLTSPAEFSPGDFLRDELEARGWAQSELAEIVSLPQQVIHEVVQGERAISEELALRLGIALGTGARFWLKLERAWRTPPTTQPQQPAGEP